jgi:hypothetical protein
MILEPIGSLSTNGGRTGMTKLIVVFNNFTNAPKCKSTKPLYKIFIQKDAWDRSCTPQVENYFILVNTVGSKGAIRCNIIRHGRCDQCGHGILRCKCRVTNCYYVTVGVGRL